MIIVITVNYKNDYYENSKETRGNQIVIAIITLKIK